MDVAPFCFVFLQSIPETAILIYLGFVLIGLDFPPLIKVFIMSLLTSLFSYYLRMMPMTPGIAVLIQLPFLIILMSMICRMSITYSAIISFLGLIFITIIETVFNIFIFNITGITIQEATTNNMVRLLFPLPEFMLLVLAIVLLKRNNIVLFNLQSFIDLLKDKLMRVNKLNTLALLLGFTVILLIPWFYIESYITYGGIFIISQRFTALVMFIGILLVVILTLVFSRKLIFVNQQERIIEIQNAHIQQMREMTIIMKTQRHDFVNHLQTVYGLIRLGELNQVEKHIAELHRDIQISGETLRLAVPELSALLMTKTGEAARRGIFFNIDIESDLSKLSVRPIDLVVILGNMINNALEAVEVLDPLYKKIHLRIYKNSASYIIEMHNYGFIPEDIREKVFDLNFSTKSQDPGRGLGLTSIKYLIEKYNGRIILDSHIELGTTIVVHFPETVSEAVSVEYSPIIHQLG